MKITAVVSSGKFSGEIQEPHPDKSGCYVMCQERFKEYKIRVVDLDSVVNGLRAGLSLRMKSAHVRYSMRAAHQIKINGLAIADFCELRGDRT